MLPDMPADSTMMQNTPAEPQSGHTSKRTITYKEPNFKLHNFTILAGELEVKVDVIKMKDSVYIWLGSRKEPTFNDLSMAMYSDYSKEVISTKLIGSHLETTSLDMAERLSKKMQKQVLISCNAMLDRMMDKSAVEKGIMIEFKQHSDKF